MGCSFQVTKMAIEIWMVSLKEVGRLRGIVGGRGILAGGRARLVVSGTTAFLPWSVTTAIESVWLCTVVYLKSTYHIGYAQAENVVKFSVRCMTLGLSGGHRVGAK